MKTVNSIILALGLFLLSIPSYAVTFHVASDGPVTGYFAGTAQPDWDSFANIKFDTSIMPGSPMENPFDNPYVSNREPIHGTEYFWGNYQEGTQAIFVLRVLTGESEHWLTSLERFNADGLTHIVWKDFTLSNGDKGVYVGWEDQLGLGDHNFKDHSLVVMNVSSDSIPAVPEPETYAMLLVGLGLIGFTLHKRRKEGNSGSTYIGGGC